MADDDTTTDAGTVESSRRTVAAAQAVLADPASAGGGGAPKTRQLPDADEPGVLAPARIPATETEQFKNWFGDSKVVDEERKPKTVYHGTTKEFEAFDKQQIDSSGHAGKGFYFAENKEIADNFAVSSPFSGGKITPKSERKSGPVISSHLSIQKPFDFDAPSSMTEATKWADAAEQVAGKDKFERADFLEHLQSLSSHLEKKGEFLAGHDVWKAMRSYVHGNNRQVNDVVSAMGYDGVSHTAVDNRGAVRSPHDKTASDFGRVHVAFEPTQIKSTQNRGTFDPTDARIHMAHGGKLPESMGAAVLSQVDALPQYPRQSSELSGPSGDLGRAEAPSTYERAAAKYGVGPAIAAIALGQVSSWGATAGLTAATGMPAMTFGLGPAVTMAALGAYGRIKGVKGESSPQIESDAPASATPAQMAHWRNQQQQRGGATSSVPAPTSLPSLPGYADSGGGRYAGGTDAVPTADALPGTDAVPALLQPGEEVIPADPEKTQGGEVPQPPGADPNADSVPATLHPGDEVIPKVEAEQMRQQSMLPETMADAVRVAMPSRDGRLRMAEGGEVPGLAEALTQGEKVAKFKPTRESNASLPDQSRTYLGDELAQRTAAAYAKTFSGSLNTALWSGSDLGKNQQAIDQKLQEALDKTPEFSKPVEVKRSFGNAELGGETEKSHIEALRKHLSDGTPFVHKGYMSTTTGDDPHGTLRGESTIEYVVQARHGLDLTPVVGKDLAHEKELLIGKDSEFRIQGIEERDGKYTVRMEQLPRIHMAEGGTVGSQLPQPIDPDTMTVDESNGDEPISMEKGGAVPEGGAAAGLEGEPPVKMQEGGKIAGGPDRDKELFAAKMGFENAGLPTPGFYDPSAEPAWQPGQMPSSFTEPISDALDRGRYANPFATPDAEAMPGGLPAVGSTVEYMHGFPPSKVRGVIESWQKDPVTGQMVPIVSVNGGKGFPAAEFLDSGRVVTAKADADAPDADAERDAALFAAKMQRENAGMPSVPPQMPEPAPVDAGSETAPAPDVPGTAAPAHLIEPGSPAARKAARVAAEAAAAAAKSASAPIPAPQPSRPVPKRARAATPLPGGDPMESWGLTAEEAALPGAGREPGRGTRPRAMPGLSGQHVQPGQMESLMHAIGTKPFSRTGRDGEQYGLDDNPVKDLMRIFAPDVSHLLGFNELHQLPETMGEAVNDLTGGGGGEERDSTTAWGRFGQIQDRASDEAEEAAGKPRSRSRMPEGYSGGPSAGGGPRPVRDAGPAVGGGWHMPSEAEATFGEGAMGGAGGGASPAGGEMSAEILATLKEMLATQKETGQDIKKLLSAMEKQGRGGGAAGGTQSGGTNAGTGGGAKNTFDLLKSAVANSGNQMVGQASGTGPRTGGAVPGGAAQGAGAAPGGAPATGAIIQAAMALL